MESLTREVQTQHEALNVKPVRLLEAGGPLRSSSSQEYGNDKDFPERAIWIHRDP